MARKSCSGTHGNQDRAQASGAQAFDAADDAE